MAYFSDKEQLNKDKKLTETISVNVWNGIVVFVNSLISNNNLAKDFPSKCPDGYDICGVNEHEFFVGANSIVPSFSVLPEYDRIETLSQN